MTLKFLLIDPARVKYTIHGRPETFVDAGVAGHEMFVNGKCVYADLLLQTPKTFRPAARSLA